VLIAEDIPSTMIRNPKFLGASEEIVTPRLRGTKPAPGDLDGFHRLGTNPAVQRFLFGKIYTLDESREKLRVFIAHWDESRFGEWTFRLHNGEFVGTGGLFYATVDENEVVALGYILDEPYWNLGLATEIAQASMRVAFEELQLAEVYALIDPENVPSQRVLEKSGFAYVKDSVYRELPSGLYRAVSPSN